MSMLARILFVAAFTITVAAQSPEPPLSDTRIPIHTLLREDLFAGFMNDDLTRFERGERNLQQLLQQRPADRAPLLAWQGAATHRPAARGSERGSSRRSAQPHPLPLVPESQSRSNALKVGVK